MRDVFAFFMKDASVVPFVDEKEHKDTRKFHTVQQIALDKMQYLFRSMHVMM